MRSFVTGKTIVLRGRIAESGEGIVYQGEAGALVKIYHDAGDQQRFAKLKAMLERPPHDPTWKSFKHLSIAWPQDIVLHDDGRCAGFVMPHIQNASDLTHVYNPSLRLRFAPRFNWFYLHHAARNYASAVDALHARGYIIGDIKPQNVLVSSNALITIVDADSFQVRNPESGHVYRCPVGSEGFTAPELLDRLDGQSFAKLNRRKRHDRFGMAIIIYLLLFGRHPYSEGRFRGRGDPPSPDDRIRQGLWGHAKSPFIAPDPAMVSLDCIHPELAQSFRQCFDDGQSDPSLRPRASHWRDALDAALAELIACEREPNHYYWRGHGRCLWCERAEMLSVDVFAIEAPPKPAPEPDPEPVAISLPRPKPIRKPRPLPAAPKKSAGGWGGLGILAVIMFNLLRAVPGCMNDTPNATSYHPYHPTVSPSTPDVSEKDLEKILNEARKTHPELGDVPKRLNDGKQPAQNLDILKHLAQQGYLSQITLVDIKTSATDPNTPKAGYYEFECTGTSTTVNGEPLKFESVPFKLRIPADYDSTGRNTYIGLFGQVYRKDLGNINSLNNNINARKLTNFELDSSWERVRE